MSTQPITPANIHDALAAAGDAGVGAYRSYPQDDYPMVVVKASKSGKAITMLSLRTVDLTTGHQPSRYDGPFPVWSHTYTDQERIDLRQEGTEVVARWSEKRQRYTISGTPVGVGNAVYHRNFSY